MSGNTENGRRKNCAGGETLEKGEGRCEQSGVGINGKQVSAELAECTPMACQRPELCHSLVSSAGDAMHLEHCSYRVLQPLARLGFWNRSATSRKDARPCGARLRARCPRDCRMSVHLRNVRHRSGRPRFRAALLPPQRSTIRQSELELFASGAQGRQLVCAWPSHPGESAMSLLPYVLWEHVCEFPSNTRYSATCYSTTLLWGAPVRAGVCVSLMWNLEI